MFDVKELIKETEAFLQFLQESETMNIPALKILTCLVLK